MAEDGPRVTRRKGMKVDLESTRGTAVVPATVVLAYDPVMQYTGELIERKPVRPAGGHLQAQFGPQIGTCSMRVPFRGNGVGGGPAMDPALDILFQACGMDLTADVLTPESSTVLQKTITIYLYEDGLLKVLSGCAGNVSIEGEVGGPAYCNFEFMGNWGAPTDVALPTLTLGATLPPRFVSGTMTIGGTVQKIGRWEINLNNAVSARQDPAAATGVLHYFIQDRDPRFLADPESVLVATDDVFGELLAGTQAALSIVLGATAGNVLTIGAPKLQYAGVQEGDRDGKQTHDIDCLLCASADAGDDELTITPS